MVFKENNQFSQIQSKTLTLYFFLKANKYVCYSCKMTADYRNNIKVFLKYYKR